MRKPKHLWFKITLAVGLLLGLLLLIQTALTYRFVSRNLVRQEAQAEAQQRLVSLGRAARLGSVKSSQLTPVLQEMVREAPKTIDWLRIVNAEGDTLAESEPVQGAPKLSRERLREAARRGRGSNTGPLVIEHGDVMIVLAPLIVRGGRGDRRQPPDFLETAVFLDGVSVQHFGPLRQNLVIGTTAGIALMAAIILLGLRFPHYMRSKIVEEELSLARRVQLDLFPAVNAARNVEFSACCIPALEVGGDLYDVFETETGEVALVLGDVSGKGLPAALLMGVVQGAVRASAHPSSTERLNHLLCQKTSRERFVSLFWALFDPQTRTLRYVNAGHLPPLLVRQGESGPEFVCLDQGGPVLGLLPQAHYTATEVAVEDGDLLIVYSDGILEAANAADEDFGEEGVRRTVQSHWNQPPAALCDAILANVRTFLNGQLPQDDQTLLVARLAGVSAFVAQSGA